METRGETRAQRETPESPVSLSPLRRTNQYFYGSLIGLMEEGHLQRLVLKCPSQQFRPGRGLTWSNAHWGLCHGGLCGGSASGKTTVANKIIEALDVPWVVLLSMDSFYKVLSEEEEELAANNEYNFDHPDAFDFELLVSVLRKLKKGKSVKVPVYDFTSHCRRKEWNFVALDLIVQHVHSQLEKRLQRKPPVVCVSSPRAASSVGSRNKETNRDEFIFYSKRLMRLLIEHALSFLPLSPVSVETPQGGVYDGRRLSGKRITGVSILRAGETMEPALMAVCKDIRLGKILIQTNHDTGEPELHYLRLPKDISEDFVVLMDSTVSTGAAALMAVRVLLDHDVAEDKIFLSSLLMAEMGVHSVAYAFPKVRIITTAVDKEVNDQFHIIPGIGNFGDRYFGTDAPSDRCGSDDGMDF
ncbi:Uridine-cytidine kinase-like 1 [Liparis tanakae]|uniref:uridine/cytidine kinase n=1 Tax=Liparis tanakae TaxID=230148 RepID=A0A4Z2FW24_9TELE|nr:Uridine-cytidine kinase-like 1 [Liparis tanakae]